MHTLEEVAESLAISYGALRDRLRALDGILDEHMSRGKKGKIFIDDNGLFVLRRLRELEQDGYSIAESAQLVNKELAVRDEYREEKGHNGASTYPQAAGDDAATGKLVDYLESENAFLKDQIAMKDQQITQLQEIVQNRLPGEVAESADPNETVEYMRRVIDRQRQEIDRLRQPWWRRLFGGAGKPAEPRDGAERSARA